MKTKYYILVLVIIIIVTGFIAYNKDAQDETIQEDGLSDSVNLNLGENVIVGTSKLEEANQERNSIIGENNKEKIVQDIVITPTDKELCELQGGKWRIWNNTLNAVPECNLPTSDAGKICTDSSQCERYCQAPENTAIGAEISGKCNGFKLTICMQEVKDGIVEVPWCY